MPQCKCGEEMVIVGSTNYIGLQTGDVYACPNKKEPGDEHFSIIYCKPGMRDYFGGVLS